MNGIVEVMQFKILTLFPDAISPYLGSSILGRAQAKSIISVELINIRDFTTDKHKTVDDTPYGGGPGMVMKIEPIDKALETLKAQRPKTKSQTKHPTSPRLRGAGKGQTKRTVVLSARGEQFSQAMAIEYAKLDELILIAGRYEGIDQRVADHLADEELSIGPYVLAGGELPALVVVEAVARLIPGVLGNPASLMEESHVLPRTALDAGRSASRIEYPQYTKPEDYRGWKVPDVLLSGNHSKINKWRNLKRNA